MASCSGSAYAAASYCGFAVSQKHIRIVAPCVTAAMFRRERTDLVPQGKRVHHKIVRPRRDLHEAREALRRRGQWHTIKRGGPLQRCASSVLWLLTLRQKLALSIAAEVCPADAARLILSLLNQQRVLHLSSQARHCNRFERNCPISNCQRLLGRAELILVSMRGAIHRT